MRIHFVTHYFHPEGNAPATRVHEMTRRWVRRGHDVTVITAVPNVPAGVPYEGYKNRWRQKEVIDGVRVVRVWTFLAPNAGTVRRIASYLSFMLTAVLAGLRLERPDVVVATSPQFFSGWAGRLLSRFRNLPFVLEVRDIWPESIVAVGAMRKSGLIRLLEKLELRLYAGATRIVTVGDAYRRKLLERGVSDPLISVVPNGVNLAFFKDTVGGGAFREEYGLGDRFVCAYVGTIGMASGLDVVIRAARRLKEAGQTDICFALVGDGANRRELEAAVSAEGLDNVVLTGRIPKARMPEVLRGVNACLVHLIRTDLFRSVLPSKIFEAAAMERPIILGVEGYSAELIEEAGAGICITPENDGELVAAVKRLAGHPEEAAAMGSAGRALVGRRFNYDILADEYLEVLNEVVNGA